VIFGGSVFIFLLQPGPFSATTPTNVKKGATFVCFWMQGKSTQKLVQYMLYSSMHKVARKMKITKTWFCYYE
jgi:hypothetical protein